MQKYLGIAGLILLGGTVYLGADTKLDTPQEFIAAETAHITTNGKPLQVLPGNRLPHYETGTSKQKLGKDVDVNYWSDIYKTPKGEWGYKIHWSDATNDYIQGFGPEDNGTVLTLPKPTPFISATSTSAFVPPNLFAQLRDWLIPTALAFASNTHSTTLVAASTQYYKVADNAPLSITGDLTISAWIKLAATFPTDAEQIIVSKVQTNAPAANHRSYSMGLIDTGGQPAVKCAAYSDGTSNNTTIYRFDATFTSGTWYQVSCVFTAASHAWAAYKNGSSLSVTTIVEAAATSIFDSTADFQVGTANSQSTPVVLFDGEIDELLVYNNDVDSTVNGAFYTDPCNPSATSLVSNWHFDNDAVDDPGTSDLTAVNSPTFTTDPAFTCTVAATTVPPRPQIINFF